MAPTKLPGTPAHRRILRAVASHYDDDPRVLAVALFGSLARTAWDAHSDLDLVVVLADGTKVDAPEEARRLCGTLGQEPVTLEPDGDDAVDLVLPSLVELSVQYRPLAATTPFVADGVLVLTGRLDAATIEAAGRANRRARSSDPARHVAACVRQAVAIDGALHRRRFWRAYQLLCLARLELLLLHADARGLRPFHALDAAADPEVEARFRRTVPGADPSSLQGAFLALLDLLEQDVSTLSADRARLTDPHRAVLAELRRRLAALDPRRSTLIRRRHR